MPEHNNALCEIKGSIPEWCTYTFQMHSLRITELLTYVTGRTMTNYKTPLPTAIINNTGITFQGGVKCFILCLVNNSSHRKWLLKLTEFKC
jgi:hypothetical protein